MRHRIGIAGVLALVAVMAFPQGAHAVGELTPAGCIDDNDTGEDVCALAVNGLAGSEIGSVAVSPDGKSVYVASASDNAITRFNRSTSGVLTPAGCITDTDDPLDGCAQTAYGLNGAAGLAVSPDGQNVYVASILDSAIARFNRDTTGALTPAGCVADNDSLSAPCGQAVNGLEQAVSVAVSPDGKSVYVASNSDSAIVRFNRSTTGALTSAGCVDNTSLAFDTCAQTIDGLFGPLGVTVSQDGLSVYAVAINDQSVVRFNRSTTGALTPMGCVSDNDTGAPGCSLKVNGLAGAYWVRTSPDGKSVYVAAVSDDAVVRFNRATTGALTSGGCIDDNDTGEDVCAQSVNGLETTLSVDVSPDGTSVYAASAGDDAVVRFNRSTTGALTSGGCIDDNDTGEDVCAQSVNGLEAAAFLTVSPDGKSVYVHAVGDAALVRFNRQV